MNPWRGMVKMHGASGMPMPKWNFSRHLCHVSGPSRLLHSQMCTFPPRPLLPTAAIASGPQAPSSSSRCHPIPPCGAPPEAADGSPTGSGFWRMSPAADGYPGGRCPEFFWRREQICGRGCRVRSSLAAEFLVRVVGAPLLSAAARPTCGLGYWAPLTPSALVSGGGKNITLWLQICSSSYSSGACNLFDKLPSSQATKVLSSSIPMLQTTPTKEHFCSPGVRDCVLCLDNVHTLHEKE
jgi:hypothetical protein